MTKKPTQKKHALFGERLRQLRIANGFKQEGLAAHLHIHRSTYTKYENGDSMPNQEILLRLAALFQVSLDYLLGNVNTQRQEASMVLRDDGSVPGLDPEETAMLLAFRLLTPEQRTSVMTVAHNYNALNAAIKAYIPEK